MFAQSLIKFLLVLLTIFNLCHSIHLDIHIPLPKGCLNYHALLANRLLRSASRPPTHDHNLTQPTEQVNLFSEHTAHLTLYLANFDLEMNNNNDAPQTSGGTDNNNIAVSTALNQTKVDAFKNTISSLNFTDVLAGLNCPLSYTTSSKDADDSIFYNIHGAYTMLPIGITPCLQKLSDSILHSLKEFLKYPIEVPSWVAELPEPDRSAAIYRTRQYGSPNVLQGFAPHVTVGYDPNLLSNLQWRIDTMNQWNDAYKQVRETCIDQVQGIALGKTGMGGTVLSSGRMGYWNVPVASSKSKGRDQTHDNDAKQDENEYYVAVE